MQWPAVMALLGALLVILSWAAVECHRYFRGRHLISGKQLAGRVVIALLIAGVVAMILWGSFNRWTNPAHELLYWSVCLAVMLIVMLLTLRDWRLLLREQHLRRAQLYQRMQEELGTLKPGESRKDE